MRVDQRNGRQPSRPAGAPLECRRHRTGRQTSGRTGARGIARPLRFGVDVQGAESSAGMLVSRLAAALGAAGVWILALAATPAFAGSEFYGIAQTATLNGEDMQEMRNAHVHTNRFILNWGWVESGPGNFRWGPADRFIGELAAHGIRAVPSVWGNPSWVAGSSSSPPVGAPVMEAQWRNLLKALVGRYGPGGVYWRTFYHQQFGAG